MRADVIQKLVEDNLPNSTVTVSSNDDKHFTMKVTCPAFVGKTLIQQHQMVNQIVGNYLKSGEIHALSMKTFLPEN